MVICTLVVVSGFNGWESLAVCYGVVLCASKFREP